MHSFSSDESNLSIRRVKDDLRDGKAVLLYSQDLMNKWCSIILYNILKDNPMTQDVYQRDILLHI